MAEKITPAAHAVLERLDKIRGPAEAGFSVGWDIAAELVSRGFALDSARGVQIADAGRAYLREVESRST